MSPSDKNNSTGNSVNAEGQSQLCSKSCVMDFSPESTSPSTSSVTLPGHGTIINIPWVTASQSTIKCSVNGQMKTFDPGEDGSIERLSTSNSGNSVFLGKSSNSLIKNNNKNYKAGSKINKLADMLAKRSQNLVEVKQNNTSDIIVNITSASKMEETVISNSVSNVMKSTDNSFYENSINSNEFKLFRKSRRKSVPNQSCSLHQWQLQSTSKSCSDISELFPLEENDKSKFNALEESMIKFQTDESTKRKVIRKNLRNVKLPLILPEKKRRSSIKNDTLNSSKVLEKLTENSSVAQTDITRSRENSNNIVANSAQSPKPSVRCAKVKKKSKIKHRKSTRLVENSTQTAEIEFFTVIKPNADARNEKPEVDEIQKSTVTYECFYCTQTFSLGSLCKAHEKTHSFRNNKHFKCQYCSKKLTSLEEFKSHCVQKHPSKYAYCIKCDERFPSKEELYSHNKENHLGKNGEIQDLIFKENPKSPSHEKKAEENEEKTDKKISKNTLKSDLKIDVSFESSKKSSVSPRNIQKCSPKETKTEEQLLEMEMLFYSHLSGNIQENLTNHLDGKIDKGGNLVRTDQIAESPDNTNSSVSVTTPSVGVPDVQISRAPSPYQTRSKTPNPLPPTAKKFKKLPNWQQKFWEKYNFPTNYRYEHRFWDKNYLNTEKSPFYLKDLSCLDIKTQLTLRENVKKLDEIKKLEESSKPVDKLKFPDYLSLIPRMNILGCPENKEDLQRSISEGAKIKKLAGKEEAKKSFKSPGLELPVVKNRYKIGHDGPIPKKITTENVKMMTRRQSSLELMKEDKEENSRKRKGSLDLSCNQRMALRRQTSLENLGSNASKIENNDQILELIANNTDKNSTPFLSIGSAEISGEWVRPRSYLCGTCCTKFTNLWELEDHKWVSHPNVWCTHYEFEDEKIDKLFQKNEGEGTEEVSEESSEMSKSKLTDLYKRYLLPHGSLKTAKLVPKTNFPEQCTKCKKNCMNSSEMHKHMLDCGGDTTWFLTMYSSPMTIKRKWRPFGSRRKKQIGRRDVKRNIPSTPTLRSYHYQHRIRTKPGDVESIQKMLANLPEKRARRAINFDDIKTRSQATIQSNRLLRKRFKTSFSNNFIKLKSIKQKNDLKQRKKEGSSKSTTDTSSESTPVGSPKRRNKFKENLQILKEENSRDGSSETSEDVNIKMKKNKNQYKKKEPESSTHQKIEASKLDKTKIKKEFSEMINERPVTRSNTFVLPTESKSKKNLSIVKEEIVDETENTKGSFIQSKERKLSKSKKKTVKKTKKRPIKKGLAVHEVLDSAFDTNTFKANETRDRVTKKMKVHTDALSSLKTCKKNSHWISTGCNSILRLKQSNKAKAELLKSMQKKLKNSRKILEKKGVQKAECGNRRSLRIKSSQQLESEPEFFSKQVANSSRKEHLALSEKDLKIKTVVISLENSVINKVTKSSNVKYTKNTDRKTEKEILPIVRRSLRNSVSSEEKLEIEKNEENSILPCHPRSLLRRNLKNEKNDSSFINISENIVNKTPQNNISIRNPIAPPQVSLLKKNRIQNVKNLRSVFKSEEVFEPKSLDLSKKDLEEMPILAKVEPIRGKICNKNEKEIPVLMPVEKEQKKEKLVTEDSVSFQVIKKRRKNSKEIIPLKIVKKIENKAVEIGNNINSSFPINDSEILCLEDKFDAEKSKKKKLSGNSLISIIEKKVKTDVKKYFLGIDPTEIDKGRSEGPDESGSDNEPLICLIGNQPQNGFQNNTLNLGEEKLDLKADDLELPCVLEQPVKFTQPKALESPISSSLSVEINNKVSYESIQLEKQTCKKIVKVKRKMKCSKKKISKKSGNKRLKYSDENKRTSKTLELNVKEQSRSTVTSTEFESLTPTEPVLPQRRSRRISKETKLSNEFVIDDPLILVDELWSDLDSDSDSTKRKSKKGKKKSSKKKTNEEKRINDVNLEELLRNFGENKEVKKNNDQLDSNHAILKIAKSRTRIHRNLTEIRKSVENRKVGKSYKRLSLKLFRFNKIHKNLGNRGVKLSNAKKVLQQKLDEMQGKPDVLPDLPFLAAEIKENPVQVIQCRAQKPKSVKKSIKKVEAKRENNDIHLKISLPLEFVNNITVFNNNHLTEPVVEEFNNSSLIADEILRSDVKLISIMETPIVEENPPSEEEPSTSSEVQKDQEIQKIQKIQEVQGGQEMEEIEEVQDASDLKNKSKRLEVIDKIFYCEICQTYYYSSSQLKIHKLSNRHKLKESELLETQKLSEVEIIECVDSRNVKNYSVNESIAVVESALQEQPIVENTEEKINDDILEMPTLEGPFIENPITRVTTETVQIPPAQPPIASFGFSHENLKDIQKAIGCTDEEMLILTLLGENTIEIENDILDLDSCKSLQSKPIENQKVKVETTLKENEKVNGAFTVNLKQRMTSALACLVNKAVYNLIQKYETAAKTGVNPEALSLLGKLSNLTRRKNILQLNELIAKRNDGEPSVGIISRDLEKKEPTVSYKYQCTICGSRFEKASTRECHISRSHKGKAKKISDDPQAVQTAHAAHEENWNDSWNYDARDDHVGGINTSQFWCSDCGINFQSPQEVLEHQKAEHQTVVKDIEQNKDSCPLQSSTIGSSDEILEGKKTRRRPKLFSSEELDQQRIIANNELRKLDRKFSGKNKNNKIKWGMDALKFTVEKENKIFVEEEKEVIPEEPSTPSMDGKNIDLVPKLNLSRVSNIPEFKVIQKSSFENRFQKIIDNKLKRKCVFSSQGENMGDDVEEEVMLVPVVVKKKSKRQKVSKCFSKKEESGKALDVYDFNDSESEGEPAVYSHIKKQAPSSTKLKLVKMKEEPSKNKADSTTKDLAPDDYDSEDSLPLSVVKKSKPSYQDDEKGEKISDDGVEKSDGILEQVEYLIEQLENETGSSKKESNSKEPEMQHEFDLKKDETSELLKEDSINSVFGTCESLRVSVANKFLGLEELQSKNQKTDGDEKKSDSFSEKAMCEKLPEQKSNSVLAEPESSQSTFDEEDSIPLVMISKKADKLKLDMVEKKCDENVTDVSTTGSEDVNLMRVEENKISKVRDFPINTKSTSEESLFPVFSSSENEGIFNDKSEKPYETLNGNVIYCRNDSMTDFESDSSSDSYIDSNFEKNNLPDSDENFIKEVTEKEDVVIICSKGNQEDSNDSKSDRGVDSIQLKETKNSKSLKKKKRFPLLTATIEENNFKRSESPKSKKEVIVRKIWNRKKLSEESTDNDEDSFISFDNDDYDHDDNDDNNDNNDNNDNDNHDDRNDDHDDDDRDDDHDDDDRDDDHDDNVGDNANNTSVENLQEEEPRTEVEKEIIVKKIWSRKKQEFEDDFIDKVEEKFDNIKINQTEISDEVVIKCGPKAKSSPKKKKSRSSTTEASKDTIMRKIWSGRCTFQTKAALKTYDSDMFPNCKENEITETQNKAKRRKRANSLFSSKRIKPDSEVEQDDDDLDSLLEEIEREQLEKAIRSEFLQLRRSEKANVELKEGTTTTVGLFTETTFTPRKVVSEKKRRKVKKKIKHPRQSVLKRKKIIRKPFRRVLPSEDRNFSETTNLTNLDGSTEQSENSWDKKVASFGKKSKTKNRKHKKHRHKHHHHKHKHKKSKHHKSAVNKHKSKHEFDWKEEEEEEEEIGNADSFTILEKICQEIPNQIENESQLESTASKRRTSNNVGISNLDPKVSELFSFDSHTQDELEIEFGSELPEKKRYESMNIYEFVEDVPDFSANALRNLKK